MSSYLLPVTLLVVLLTGCSSQPEHAMAPLLASNRVNELKNEMAMTQHSPIISVKSVRNTIYLSLMMPDINQAQLTNRITQHYCQDKETRRLLEANVDYQITVFDAQPKKLDSFHISEEQCH
ncbi:type II secretion system pilot lipoprotein GspS-beta [Vibrio mediterranei]